jgi:hypothetical protein
VAAPDLELLHVADDPAEVVRIITEAHNHQGLARELDD